MRIVVFNLKGGQGKSSIALNLALSLNFDVISNDKITKLEKILPEDNFMKIDKDQEFPDIIENLNIVYDLGGWIDERAIKPIKESDLIIIPMINTEMNNEVSVNSINQVKQYNKNIALIVNKSKKGDYEFMRDEVIKICFPNDNFPIFELMDTTAFEQMLKRKMAIKDIVNIDPLLKYNYRKINGQFNEIINFINNIQG
jgi:cellulose biosynthesis protein BcsQ